MSMFPTSQTLMKTSLWLEAKSFGRCAVKWHVGGWYFRQWFDIVHDIRRIWEMIDDDESLV